MPPSDQPILDAPPSALIEAVREVVKGWRRALCEARRPPDLIFHYCDANALLNILQTQKLWATATRYLNDKTELVMSFRNVPQHLANLPDSAALRIFTEGHAKGLFSTTADLMSNAIGMEQFVTCFSEDEDSLSQWRAYGSDGTGFALGFAPSELAMLQGDAVSDGVIRGMKYGAADESDLVVSLASELIAVVEPYVDALETTGWNTPRAEPLTTRQWLGLRFGECIADLAFESKDVTFRDEKEWRIYANAGDLQFRATPRGIVPYRSLDARAVGSNRMPLKRIVMGPKLDPLQTTRVLMYLTESQGYGHGGVDIRPSRCPYR